MIRTLFVCISLVIMSLSFLSAQEDRVMHFSYLVGEDTYFLSFANGGGEDLLTKKMIKPGPNETFFLISVGEDSLKRGLYLITSLEGFLLQTDDEKQLTADEKEIEAACFFRIQGDSLMTIFDWEGWVLQFSMAEKAFAMAEEQIIAGKNFEELLAAGLKIEGQDVPGGIEGIDVIKTSPNFELLKESPIFLKNVDPKTLQLRLELLKGNTIKLENQIKNNH